MNQIVKSRNNHYTESIMIKRVSVRRYLRLVSTAIYNTNYLNYYCDSTVFLMSRHFRHMLQKSHVYFTVGDQLSTGND